MQYMLMMVAGADPAAGGAAADGPAGAAAASAAATSARPAPGEPCWMPWAREVAARGVVLGDGAQLQAASTATTVGIRDGEVLLSDGPFAETKEQIVGYSVIECADLDEAIDTASRHPVTRNGGRVEVRPILASG
jgi:hypothetical protein